MLLKECANDLKITTKIVFSLGGVADVIVLINIQVSPDFQACILITMSFRNQPELNHAVVLTYELSLWWHCSFE